MNCEHVFEILTRAPFPQGETTDSDVERHLSVCHDCRQLAEALRPATDLFHEAIREDESNPLPAYQGRLATSADVAVTTAPWLAEASTQASDGEFPAATSNSPESSRESRTFRLNSFSQWICLGLGALACSLVAAMIASWSVAPGKQAADPADVGRIQLASLNLPTACMTLTEAPEDESRSLQAKGYFCCSHCHAPAATRKQRPPITALAVVTSSCTACHLVE